MSGEWKTLAQVLVHRARHDARRPAFADEREAITFAELMTRAEMRADALREAGVGPGDRVAIAMTPGVSLVESFWSAQLIGAAPCVLNPFVPNAALARRSRLIEPRATISDTGIRSSTGVAGRDDVAFLQLTSGSTGEPRASVILQRNALSFLSTWRGRPLLNPHDVFVSWVPPWHDLGLVRFLIAPVYHGAVCHIVPPAVRTIPQWLTTIAEVGGTYSAAPDFALRLAVRMVDRGAIDLSGLPWLTCGGEPIRASTLERFAEHFGCGIEAITPGYGLGEAVVGVSAHLPGERFRVDDRGNVSCGPVNPGLELRAGTSAAEPEEIRIRGEAVFAGYFDAPTATAEVLRDGWLHTGDSGYLDREGNLYVLGRREGMIKRAGAVVAPRELEEAAQTVPGVGVVAAISLPRGPLEDDAIVVAVENANAAGTDDELARAVSQAVQAELGFGPSRVAVMPRGAIPRTENGKLRHLSLRALLERESAPTGPPLA